MKCSHKNCPDDECLYPAIMKKYGCIKLPKDFKLKPGKIINVTDSETIEFKTLDDVVRYIERNLAIKETTSDYYDFSDHIVLKWIWQSIIYKDVSFYRDKDQKCWCRKISNVPGKIYDGAFHPRHKLVLYKQIINVTDSETIERKTLDDVAKDAYYQCDLCKKVYKKGLSDKEAESEAMNNFGEIPEELKSVVCDGCFKKTLSENIPQHIICK